MTEECIPVPASELRLYDVDGTLLAIIDDFRSLQYGMRVNDAGFFTLQISYYNAARSLFKQDCILEVRRKIPGYRDWYREFVGHCEDFNTTFFSNGNTQFVITGSGFNGLLGRAVVGYEQGTAEAQKSVAAETAMKEYVYENVGAAATIANGRSEGGVRPAFYVDASGGLGATWSGDRSGKIVLTVLQDIANFSSIDYNVVVHPTLGMGSYLFETYEGQLGLDRTTVGLNSTTGLNAAGNAPHIFSMERGNIDTVRYSTKYKGSVNRVYVFGQDELTGLQEIVVRTNVAEAYATTLSLREAMRGGGSQNSTTELEVLGDEYLEDKKPIGSFEFVPHDTPSSLYGVHYSLGDRLTILAGDETWNKRLVRVAITVSGSGIGESSKDFEFADIP